MDDRLYSGRPFRTLNVIDEADRGGLGIDVATSIAASRMIRVIEQLIENHGKLLTICCDHGAELTSYAFTEWWQATGIEIRFIPPGKPYQNAFIERFSRTYRGEVLRPCLFDSIEHLRQMTDA